MIYCNRVENWLYIKLMTTLPHRAVLNIANRTKLDKLVQPGDMVINFDWSDGAYNYKEKKTKSGVNFFPDVRISLLLQNRCDMLELLSSFSNMCIEHESFTSHDCLRELIVPSFDSNKTVVKIGNEHQGQHKYLKNHYDVVRTKESVVFERFIPNARSFRVAIIGSDIYIIEHRNSENARTNPEKMWIKNIDPIETVYSVSDVLLNGMPFLTSIIEDAKRISEGVNYDFLGIDYVVSETESRCLEINDMIGIPENTNMRTSVLNYIMNLISEKGLSNND